MNDCQGRGIVEGRVTIKSQEGYLGGEDLVLYLDCSSHYTCATMDRTIHIHCTNAKFLVYILYYNYVRCNHWKKLGDEYKGYFCTVIATSFDFTKISK